MFLSKKDVVRVKTECLKQYEMFLEEVQRYTNLK